MHDIVTKLTIKLIIPFTFPSLEKFWYQFLDFGGVFMMHSSYYRLNKCCDISVASVCTSTVNLTVYSATYC